jgi:kynurenine formamidase
MADLAGVVVAVAEGTRAVDSPLTVPGGARGRAVLVRTGWDRHFGTERYGVDAPFLTGAAAQWLADQGAALVGIDSVNIDDTRGGERPAHSGLLAAGIPVVEHLTGLGQLVGREFRFFAIPPKVTGFGTFPVRAFALV